MLFLGSGSYVGGRAVRIDGRPETALPIAWIGAVIGVGVAAVVLGFVRPSEVGVSDLAWSIAGGVGVAAARPLLYQGLSKGPIIVFAPVAALASLVVPVVLGAAIGQGLSPAEVGGLAMAFPAVVFLASAHRLPAISEILASRILGLALLTGSSFGLASVFFGLTNEDAGLSVVVLSLAAAVVLLPGAKLVGQPFPRPHRPALVLAIVLGLVEVVGELAIITALQRGPVAVAAAIIGLAPAVTMGWARVVDSEPIYRLQLPGAALGAGSVILFALG